MSKYLDLLKGKLVQLIETSSGREIFGYLKDYDDEYLIVEKPIWNAYIWHFNPAIMLYNIGTMFIDKNPQSSIANLSTPIPINMASKINKDSELFQCALLPKKNYLINEIANDEDNEYIQRAYKFLIDLIEETYNYEKALEDLKKIYDGVELNKQLKNVVNDVLIVDKTSLDN